MSYLTESIGGVYYNDGYTGSIDVTNVNQWYLIGGTSSLHPLSTSGWTNSSGRLIYAGKTRNFIVSGQCTMTPGTNGTIVEFAILKNGVSYCPCSKCSTKLVNTTDEQSVFTTAMFRLSSGDYLNFICQADKTAILSVIHFCMIVRSIS